MKKQAYTLAVAMALLAFAGATPLHAQHARVTPGAGQSAVWSAFIGPQVARSLESPVPEIRLKTLVHVIEMARSFGDELDLSEAVPALLKVYREDPDERCRVAAVVGLHALGDEGGMQQVRQSAASQPSKRVQHMTLAALMDHYGPGVFEDAEDLARLAASVRAYSEENRLVMPAIAKKQ